MPKKKEIPKLLAEEGTKFRKGVNIAYRAGLNIWDYSKKSLWVVATGIPYIYIYIYILFSYKIYSGHLIRNSCALRGHPRSKSYIRKNFQAHRWRRIGGNS